MKDNNTQVPEAPRQEAPPPKKKQTISIPAAVIIGVTALALGAGATYAAINLTKSYKARQIASQIASRLDAPRSRFGPISAEERLEHAVENGTITSDQKQQVQDKQAELKKTLESIDSKQLTTEARQTARQEAIEKVQQWAEDNNIPPGMVLGGVVGGPKGSVSGRGKRGPNIGRKNARIGL